MFQIVYFVTSSVSANTFGYNQMLSLVEQGYSVHLICGDGYLKEEIRINITSINQIRTLQRNISPISDVRSAINLFILLKRIKPDLMIYSTPKAAFIGSLTSILLGIGTRIYQVWGIRWQNLNGIKLLVVKLSDIISFTFSTHIIVVSHSLFSFLRDFPGSNKMAVLGSGSTTGVDTKIFSQVGGGKNTNRPFIIGFAGRLAVDKGVIDLIQVFEKIQEYSKGVILEIIGDIDNDDMIPIETVRRIRLNPKVKIFKSMAQGDLASRMQSWDLQVFLSKREGLGNVILEAGACGVPTLGWDIIGVQDAIPYFAKNCLIPYGNFHILQEAILSFIDKPLTQSEKKTLSQWYIDNYDQTKVLKSFVVFIMSCLGDGYGTKKN